MKSMHIHYTPFIGVRFTKTEAEVMLTVASHHYDGVCNEAAMKVVSYRGGRPGFLRGIYNCIKNCGPQYVHMLEFREIDTLLKIMEMAHYHKFTTRKAKAAAFVIMGLHAAINHLRDNAAAAVTL